MIPSTKQKYWQQHINQWRKSGFLQLSTPQIFPAHEPLMLPAMQK